MSQNGSGGDGEETILKTLNFDVLDRYQKTLMKLGPVCRKGEVAGSGRKGEKERRGKEEAVLEG